MAQANNVPAYGSKFTALGISNIQGNPGVIVNPQEGQADIKPERQKEFETGIDFSVLHDRLGFVLTWYNKSIDDFLMQSNPPSSSGFSTAWANAGNLRNRGGRTGIECAADPNKACGLDDLAQLLAEQVVGDPAHYSICTARVFWVCAGIVPDPAGKIRDADPGTGWHRWGE